MLSTADVKKTISEEKRKAIAYFLIKKRKDIVQVLAERRKLTHSELAEAVGTSVASLSNILVRFESFEYKLIECKSEGKYKYYFLTDLCKEYYESCNQDNIAGKKIVEHEVIQLKRQVRDSLAELQEEQWEDWEFFLEEAFIKRLWYRKIADDKSEQLVDSFIIGIEKLLLNDYDEYSRWGLSLLGSNSILQNRFTGWLERFEAFKPILNGWNREEDIVEIYELLAQIVNECEQFDEWQTESDNMIVCVVKGIIDNLRFLDKQDINDCFMRYMAGNKALSAYMTQLIWSKYK